MDTNRRGFFAWLAGAVASLFSWPWAKAVRPKLVWASGHGGTSAAIALPKPGESTWFFTCHVRSPEQQAKLARIWHAHQPNEQEPMVWFGPKET